MAKRFLIVLVFLMVLTGTAAAEDLYKIYPTENFHAFIELNTATGQVWLCTIAVSDDGVRGRYVINEKPLIKIPEDEQPELQPGRFTLIPTQNIWNFIMLDTTDGRVWQVQYTMKTEERDKYMWIQRIYNRE